VGCKVEVGQLFQELTHQADQRILMASTGMPCPINDSQLLQGRALLHAAATSTVSCWL
jgi:hypothetical protein